MTELEIKRSRELYGLIEQIKKWSLPGVEIDIREMSFKKRTDYYVVWTSYSKYIVDDDIIQAYCSVETPEDRFKIFYDFMIPILTDVLIHHASSLAIKDHTDQLQRSLKEREKELQKDYYETTMKKLNLKIPEPEKKLGDLIGDILKSRELGNESR